MKPRAKVLLIKPTMTIRKVMEIIQAGPRTVDDAPGHVALAVNGADKLIGVVTALSPNDHSQPLILIQNKFKNDIIKVGFIN